MTTGSRHDEYERVLRSMRERLDAVSEQIAKALTKAHWQAEMAPMAVRVSARAAAADIAHTQAWLHERLRIMPFDPQQRLLVMQDLLQSQFVALQKVTSILEDLMALRDRPVSPEYLPPAMRSEPQVLPPLGPPRAPEPPISQIFDAQPQRPQPAEPPLYWPPPAAPAPPAGYLPPPAWDPPPQPAPLRLSDLEPDARTPPRVSTVRTAPPGETGKSKKKKGRKRDGSPSTTRLAIRTALLLTALVAVPATGYFAYKRLWSHPKSVTRSATKNERISIGDPSARTNLNPGAHDPPVRIVGDGQSRVPSPPPMSSPPLEPRAPLPGLVIAQPAAPQAPTRPTAAEQFVPVIATHRDRAALVAIMTDLKRQFSTILGRRQFDAQAVNLGSGGIWHHLVLMPPGPRQQAMAVCDELRAAGYTRCTVRPY